MALFKATVKTVTVVTGIIEANSKEEITAELEKVVSPAWWATHDQTMESTTATELVELENKAE